MGAAINGNAVGIVSEASFTDFLHAAAMLIENRDNAALSGNIQTSKNFIKGEHVWIGANRVDTRHLFCFEIKHRQLCILFTGNERQTMLTVNVESMTSAATGQGIARNDLIFNRIDLGQF